jgi:hypothetical protein
MKRLLWILAACALAGCDTSNDAAFRPQIVVQGFLYAGEPLDSIVVRKTIAIDATNPSERVSGALVVIYSDASNDTLREDSQIEGRYVPANPIIISPDVTYHLYVNAASLGTATSETHVPKPIHLDSASLNGRRLSIDPARPDSVDYPTLISHLTDPSIHLFWSASPGSAGYGIEGLSLDPHADTIVLEGYDSPLSDSTSSGRYRFFILSTDEQAVWIQFRRYGLNAIRALAIDKNYQDYISGLFLSRSQFNNSTLHVTGGLGVFASAARATMRVYLR